MFYLTGKRSLQLGWTTRITTRAMDGAYNLGKRRTCDCDKGSVGRQNTLRTRFDSPGQGRLMGPIRYLSHIWKFTTRSEIGIL